MAPRRYRTTRQLWGTHNLALVWRSRDGRWRLPVGFRLWRPRRSCRPKHYCAALELAEQLVTAPRRDARCCYLTRLCCATDREAGFIRE